MKRYALSMSLGSAVTVALFLLMQSLVAYSSPSPPPEITGQVIDFVMVRPDPPVVPPREIPDQRDFEPPPSQPPIELGPTDRPVGTAPVISFPEPEVEEPSGPQPMSGDVIPMVRIEPTYPPRPYERGIEGWVLVEFSISPAGTVIDPIVVDSEPPGTFDRAALRAVARWRYKPKIEMGSAVTRRGVQVVLSFALD